ncbi:MAG: outer membrane lipoprotein carrier protein LolA [Porticoccaceae bacterium]
MIARLLLLALLAFAGGAAADDELLRQLAPRMAHIQSLTGSFEQARHISVLAAPLLSSGEFSYRRGEGIQWRTTHPVENEIRITPGQGVAVVDGGGNARPLPASEAIAGIFLGLFAGDLDSLGEYFTLTGQRQDSGWSLRLTPRHPQLAAHLDTILIDGDEHIERVEIREANGDRSELRFQVTASTAPSANGDGE